jgi:hypothetical protein
MPPLTEDCFNIGWLERLSAAADRKKLSDRSSGKKVEQQ